MQLIHLCCRMRVAIAANFLLLGPVLSAAEIPSSLLRRELERRQNEGERPECGSDSDGSYNMPLHVFALVLILVLSTVGRQPLNVYIFLQKLTSA